MPSWTDHLREDELPYLNLSVNVDRTLRHAFRIMLLRLAEQRALYENFVDTYSPSITNDPSEPHTMTPEEEEEMAKDLAAMDRCEEAGGCVWEPCEAENVVKFFNGFPAQRCRECGAMSRVPTVLPPV